MTLLELHDKISQIMLEDPELAQAPVVMEVTGLIDLEDIEISKHIGEETRIVLKG